jgi:hypothetical protein
MKGVIEEVNFMPMVKGVPSILRLTVEMPNGFITLEEAGSIEDLSKTFGFKIISEREWDLTGLKGKKVHIKKMGKAHKFKSFENSELENNS